jgi:hypothetical protein
MRKTLIIGLGAAILGALAVLFGSWLNLGLTDVLLGTALGAGLGLAPGAPVGRKLAAFLVGFVIAWIGYAIRAAALPDVTMSRAIVVFISVFLIALACAVSRGRLPLWAAFLGAVGMTGAYEFTYVAAPYNFISDSVSTATGILVPVGFGFLTAVIAALVPDFGPAQVGAEPSEPAEPNGPISSAKATA